MAKDKFLARNCSGRKDGRGVAGGGFTARLSQHKLEAMTKSPGQKTETDQQRTELVSLSPLFQFECFFVFFAGYFLYEIFTFVRVLVLVEAGGEGGGFTGEDLASSNLIWMDDGQIKRAGKRAQSGLPCKRRGGAG